MTLTEFLTARLDEQETAECGCETNQFGDIRCHRCGEYVNVKCWNCGTTRGSGLCPAPRSARIIADIASKRAILALHEPVDEEPDGWCNLCDGDGWPCGTMALLAQPYAEHPDFDPAWRV